MTDKNEKESKEDSKTGSKEVQQDKPVTITKL